jgi:hypothetical protein
VSDWVLDLLCNNYSAADQPAETKAVQVSMTQRQLLVATHAFGKRYRSGAVTDGSLAAADQPEDITIEEGSLELKADDGEDCAAARHPAPARPASMGLFWRHYKALVWREWLMATRNPADAAGRLVAIMFISVLGGLVFYQRGQLPAAAQHHVLQHVHAGHPVSGGACTRPLAAAASLQSMPYCTARTKGCTGPCQSPMICVALCAALLLMYLQDLRPWSESQRAHNASGAGLERPR